jgi:hypothetical protein
MKTRIAALSRLGLGAVLSAWVVAPQLASTAAAADAGLSIQPRGDRGELEVRYKDRRLLLYAFAGNQFKPYVKELCTLKGDNLLLDAPSDHLHHHGLMYAITVNGVNFWEEAKEPGHQVSAEPPAHSVGVGAGGLPQAALAHKLYWVAHTNAGLADARTAALLIETRRLILAVDEPKQEVALQWQSEFEVGSAASKVTLSGADYHGLGVRFIRAFDRTAKHSNSENLPYPTQGKRDVLGARWSAVANAWDGHEAMLALFTRPAETRGPTMFFSMLEPFTYLSVTQGLDKTPLEYASGDKFSLRYLLTVYPAAKSREFLQQRSEMWLKR